MAYDKLMYRGYLFKCRKKDIAMELTLDEFNDLSKKNCFYCNSPPAPRLLKYDRPGSLKSVNGVDRVDSTKGYSVLNSVPCCINCNFMKRNLDVNDFIKHIYKIYNHLTQNEGTDKLDHILSE